MRKPLLLSFAAAGVLLLACGSDVTSGGATFQNDGGSDDAGGSSSSSSGSPGDGGGSSSSGDSGSDGSSGDGGNDPPYAVVYSAAAPIGIDSRTPVAATFATNGALDSYTYSADEAPERGMAAVYNVFKDATSGVGRWADGTLGGKFFANTMPSLNGNQGFHYGFVVRPTTIPAPAAAAYTFLGASAPSIDDGSLPVGTLTGDVATAVDGANMRLGVELTFTMPNDTTYTVSTTGGVATPSTSAVVTTGQTLGLAGTAPVTSAGVACQGGGTCTATIRAMRTADNDRIVIAFVVTAGASGKAIRGAAAFAKQ